jgi:hypothetical protein
MYYEAEPPQVEPVPGRVFVSSLKVQFDFQTNGVYSSQSRLEQGVVGLKVQEELEKARFVLSESFGALQARFDVTRNYQMSWGLQCVSGLTLMLVPYYLDQVITVEGKLMIDEDVLANASATATINSWGGVFLIFGLFVSDFDLGDKALHQLTAKVAHELKAMAKKANLPTQGKVRRRTRPRAPSKSKEKPARESTTSATASEGLFGDEGR